MCNIQNFTGIMWTLSRTIHCKQMATVNDDDKPFVASWKLTVADRYVLSSLQIYHILFCVAPQMQQQELAQMRQRDANLTALAAIGPRKKRKLDSPGGSGAGTEVGSSRILTPSLSRIHCISVESAMLKLPLRGTNFPWCSWHVNGLLLKMGCVNCLHG